jgi:hypothetical protein
VAPTGAANWTILNAAIVEDVTFTGGTAVRARHTSDGTGVDRLRGAYIASPGNNFTVVARFKLPVPNPTNQQAFGVLLYESVTTKGELWGLGYGTNLLVTRFTSPSVFSTNTKFYTSYTGDFRDFWIKVVNDGANITMYWSSQGYYWHNVGSETLTNFFTTRPDKIGFGIDSESNDSPAFDVVIECGSFKATSP